LTQIRSFAQKYFKKIERDQQKQEAMQQALQREMGGGYLGGMGGGVQGGLGGIGGGMQGGGNLGGMGGSLHRHASDIDVTAGDRVRSRTNADGSHLRMASTDKEVPKVSIDRFGNTDDEAAFHQQTYEQHVAAGRQEFQKFMDSGGDHDTNDLFEKIILD
jgi:hypothetical protein